MSTGSHAQSKDQPELGLLQTKGDTVLHLDSFIICGPSIKHTCRALGFRYGCSKSSLVVGRSAALKRRQRFMMSARYGSSIGGKAIRSSCEMAIISFMGLPTCCWKGLRL